MKKKLQIITVTAAIAASFLVGCGAPRITERADNPGQPSIVLVQQGYDSLGRKWEDESYHASERAQPAPVVQQVSQPAEPKTITRNYVDIQNFTGTITAIDSENREVTLKDSQGQIETFSVAKDVQRFGEAKVGDKVTVNYNFGFNAEVRKPTAEEQQNPLVILQATGRTGPNDAPAGSNSLQVRAVVTIEGLDRAALQTITVKGPPRRKILHGARVADPSRFDQVNIGDTVVMTFTEAEAVSLTPAGQ